MSQNHTREEHDVDASMRLPLIISRLSSLEWRSVITLPSLQDLLLNKSYERDYSQTDAATDNHRQENSLRCFTCEQPANRNENIKDDDTSNTDMNDVSKKSYRPTRFLSLFSAERLHEKREIDGEDEEYEREGVMFTATLDENVYQTTRRWRMDERTAVERPSTFLFCIHAFSRSKVLHSLTPVMFPRHEAVTAGAITWLSFRASPFVSRKQQNLECDLQFWWKRKKKEESRFPRK